MNWYLAVLKNYAGFEGRARRKEYWMFILFNSLFLLLAGLVDEVLGKQNNLYRICPCSFCSVFGCFHTAASRYRKGMVLDVYHTDSYCRADLDADT